eukprot:1160703-Pelagomonas_calceolata.AAC.2
MKAISVRAQLVSALAAESYLETSPTQTAAFPTLCACVRVCVRARVRVCACTRSCQVIILTGKERLTPCLVQALEIELPIYAANGVRAALNGDVTRMDQGFPLHQKCFWVNRWYNWYSRTTTFILLQPVYMWIFSFLLFIITHLAKDGKWDSIPSSALTNSGKTGSEKY